MSSIVLLFMIGIVAGFVSGMIGGGSGLILAPAQILMGIDPKIATTTTHFGFIGVSIGAMARFKREKEIAHPFTGKLVAIAFISGIVGPYALLSFDTGSFQRIVGGLILLCIPFFVFKKRLGRGSSQPSNTWRALGYLALFVILTLQVAFGAATGILAIFVLVSFFGLSMIETSAALRLPNLVSSLVGLVVYARYDAVNFWYGSILLGAMVIGGYFGSHVAIRGGDDLVKYLFVVLATLIAVQLFF